MSYLPRQILRSSFKHDRSFCGHPSGGVNWSKSAATIAHKLVRKGIGDEPMRVEARPANFRYTDSTGKKTTTLVAVYAQVDVMFEVRGICSQLAHDTADKAGLGLANSQFHMTKPLHSKTSTCELILQSHLPPQRGVAPIRKLRLPRFLASRMPRIHIQERQCSRAYRHLRKGAKARQHHPQRGQQTSPNIIRNSSSATNTNATECKSNQVKA